MTWLRMNWLIVLFSFLAVSAVSAQEDRAVAHYNLSEEGVGLKGYDPVSYFAEGGSTPQKGSESIALDYKGVTYYFASEDNRDTFLVMPERYEPTYGGYCAWAMSSRRGSKVDIDPLLFTISGNRAHFFIAPGAKTNFDRDVARFEKRADRNWERITGEKPRL